MQSQRRAQATVKQRKNGRTKKGGRISTPLGLGGILNPAVRRRWPAVPVTRLGITITPQYIESILRGGLAGFHIQQWELFDLMIDTWPELASCIQELTYGVQRKKQIFEPYHEEDEAPTPTALDKQDFVSEALRNMAPNPSVPDENDLRGTTEDLLDAWFKGLVVLQTIWEPGESGILPRTTLWMHPCTYGFDENGQLGLRVDKQGNPVNPIYTAQPLPENVLPFPQHRFLIGTHRSKAGPILGAALMRSLAWWWCAANFSSDWLLNLGQLFGIPWRIAFYDTNSPPETLAAIDAMMQNMGSSTWARFPLGTEIELKEPSGKGSDHSPQGEILDRADRYARLLILGQTMTGTQGTTGKGGGQAFGRVEQDVKEDRIDAAGKFVETIINNQLIKSILVANYGDDTEAPTIRFLEDEEGDLVAAQRDTLLSDKGLPIGVDFMRKKFGIPEPAEGEETLSKPSMIKQPGSFGGSEPIRQLPDEAQGPEPAAGEPNEKEPAKAAYGAYAPGHPFFGNQYTQTRNLVQDLRDIQELPRNEKNAIDHLHKAFGVLAKWKNADPKLMSALRDIEALPRNQLNALEHLSKIFTILDQWEKQQSARAKLAEDEQQQKEKLQAVLAIQDEAICTKELQKLAEEMESLNEKANKI